MLRYSLVSLVWLSLGWYLQMPPAANPQTPTLKPFQEARESLTSLAGRFTAAALAHLRALYAAGVEEVLGALAAGTDSECGGGGGGNGDELGWGARRGGVAVFGGRSKQLSITA